MLNVAFRLLVLIGLTELSNGVIVFISELPPVRAQLTDVSDVIFLETLGQRTEFIVNRGQILQIQLQIFAQFKCFPCLLLVIHFQIGRFIRDFLMVGRQVSVV